MRKMGLGFCFISFFLTTFAWAGSPVQDDPTAAYTESPFGDTLAEPDAEWLAINQKVIDESVQAVHAALRAVEKASVNRLVQFAKDCDAPGRWTRESENVGEAPDALVSFGEAEVYKDGRVPYIVKIVHSDCSGLKTETTTYYYRKDRTLAYSFKSTETYADDGSAVRIEEHTYVAKSGKILATYETAVDTKSGQPAGTENTPETNSIAYTKANKLPFYGLLF